MSDSINDRLAGGFTVGKLYMLSPNNHRDCYWFYPTGRAKIYRGEPCMMIRPIDVLSGHILYALRPGPMILVCNCRGEVGLINLADVAKDKQPAFVPYGDEQQQQ